MSSGCTAPDAGAVSRLALLDLPVLLLLLCCCAAGESQGCIRPVLPQWQLSRKRLCLRCDTVAAAAHPPHARPAQHPSTLLPPSHHHTT